jgi:hypothetical protein
MNFPVISCPKEIREEADMFKGSVGIYYKAFTAVLCGYIFGFSSLSDIVRYFFFSPSVSTMDRFFQSDTYKQLNRYHRRRLLKLHQKVSNDINRYAWAVDDTIISHWGKKIWGTYYWKDHNTGGNVWGHKLMVLGLIDKKRKVLIPVFWELLHREGQEDLGAKHKKGNNVAYDLLAQATEMGFPKYPVVMDSWFAGKELFEKLDNNGYKFVIELKNNRKVVKHSRSVLYESISTFFSNRFRHKIYYLNRPKWATCATLLLNNMEKKLKVIAVANKKGLAHECFAYYATNQLAWDATKVWGLSRDRWSIEVQFRDLKQLFTLGGAAMQSKNAVETTISMSVIAMTVVRLKQLAHADANENQHQRPCSASSIVQNYALDSLKRGIHKLASSTDLSAIRKFKVRLRLENFGQKPTFTPTEKSEHDGRMTGT